MVISIEVSSEELEAILPQLKELEAALSALREERAEQEDDSCWRKEHLGE